MWERACSRRPFASRLAPTGDQRSAVDHRQVQALLVGAIDGDVVTGIGVTHYTGGRVVEQYTGDALSRELGASVNADLVTALDALDQVEARILAMRRGHAVAA